MLVNMLKTKVIALTLKAPWVKAPYPRLEPWLLDKTQHASLPSVGAGSPLRLSAYTWPSGNAGAFSPGSSAESSESSGSVAFQPAAPPLSCWDEVDCPEGQQSGSVSEHLGFLQDLPKYFSSQSLGTI